MPIGYLITLALLGVCTTAAMIRARRFGRSTYFLAVVLNEIPHAAALLLTLTTVLAWVEGDLAGPTGVVLVVVAGLVLVGLAELTRRALLARPAVAASLLDRGLEPGRRPLWTWLRPLLFPFPWRPRSVVRLGRLSYGPHSRQRLDVYRPRDRAVTGPVLVYFHGGGYYSGSNRREGRALLHRLAARGWVCISATYRLRPEAGFSDHVDDARAALAWAHDNAAVHGGDTRTVVMAGSSAGAHLAALCALDQGPRTQWPRIDAAICLYGYYGRYYGRGTDESPVSTPLALDPSGAPPVFMAHGDHDSWAPVEDARALFRHLSAGSSPAAWYVELPGGQHGFDALFSWRNAAVMDGIDRFLDQMGITSPVRHPDRADGHVVAR